MYGTFLRETCEIYKFPPNHVENLRAAARDGDEALIPHEALECGHRAPAAGAHEDHGGLEHEGLAESRRPRHLGCKLSKSLHDN